MCARNCTSTISRSGPFAEGIAGTLAQRVWLRVRRFTAVYGDWRRRARLRGYLTQMTDHELMDIGLSRGEAMREASLPFWRRIELGRRRRPFPTVASDPLHPVE